MIEMTKNDILKVAQLTEQHGADVVETYLFGDRCKGEIVWRWNKDLNKWVDLYIYPWLLEHPAWDEFYIGASPYDREN